MLKLISPARTGLLALSVTLLACSGDSPGGPATSLEPAPAPAPIDSGFNDTAGNPEPEATPAPIPPGGLAAPPPDKALVYQVEYAADAVLIEGDARQALQSIDTQMQRYTFDAQALDDAGISLRANQVMLIEGLALRRISGVNRSGNMLMVDTDEAALNELIENGELAWDFEVTPEVIAKSRLKVGKSTCSPSIAGNKVTFDCTVNAYSIQVTVEAKPDITEITYQVKQSVGSKATASFSGTGKLGKFRNRANVQYKDGKLMGVDYGTDGLNGELEIQLSAAGAGNSNISYKFPAPALSLPFSVGPIPLSIDIGIQVVAQLEVPAEAQASAQAGAVFSYNADTGLKYSGGDTQVDVSGQLGSATFKDGTFDAGSTFAKVDAQFGLAFPRVALNVLNQEVAFVRTGFLIGTLLTFGPVCKSGYTKLKVEGGYGLKILGVPLVPAQTETLAERERRASQNNCR